MRTRVRLDSLPDATARFVAERVVCEALGVDLAGARRVLDRFPSLLPIAQSNAEARDLATKLTELGIATSLVVVPDGAASHCVFHPRYLEATRCTDCSRALCLICERLQTGVCSDCWLLRSRRRRNQRVRVAVLLSILFGVCLFGAREWRRRNLGWERSHRVAIILVQDPSSPLSAELRDAFAARASSVEHTLMIQRQRYAPNGEAPVNLSVFGPIDESLQPPRLEGSNLWELLQINLALNRYADAHDTALSLDSSNFDVRIYMRVMDSQDSREAAEGIGQQRGRLGVVSTQISPDGIDFAWFVAIHEYLHTRGASDKYGADGRATNPQGYADPTRMPLLPQEGTELMARGRPESLIEEDIPGEPATWVVGKWTAEEIGW